ncbi:hypothetical protein C7820_1452 [Paenibacillus sp. VMFN-D1]|nr:hypothetical protein C7820_1452 [Paenibacillus sp. VMFN-D1]
MLQLHMPDAGLAGSTILTGSGKGSPVICRIVRAVSKDKNIVPLKVAILAAFLFYRYKFLSRVEDKNLYRLP